MEEGNLNDKFLKNNSEKPTVMNRILDIFERIGGKLPDAVTIFVILCCIIMVLSFILNKLEVTVIHPGTNESLPVINLLSRSSIQNLISSAIKVFQEFPPLGVVLVSMIGIGVADKSGLLESTLNMIISKIPSSAIYVTVILLGLIFTGIGDAGFIILPPLAAIMFLKLKKNPIVGILLAYAGAAIGFSSGLFVSLNDILITSFTNPAAKMIDETIVKSPTMTYYFNVVNAVFQTFIIIFVTKKYIEPRFPYKSVEDEDTNLKITQIEKKGVIKSLMAAGIYFIFMILLSMGSSSILRDSNGSLISINSTFMRGLIIFMTLGFFIPGVIYGRVTGKIKSDKDTVRMVGQSLGEMGGYIFIVFVSAQFLSMFTKSNLGIVLAVKGAELLKESSISGIPLLIMFIFLVGFINLFIGSASAKWAILAPIFIPMFMLLEYPPEITQMAYRIGDSSTNMITPLFPYMPILLAVCKKYDKDFSVGKLIANMLPYGFITLIGSIILFSIFILFKIPLGL